uniref:Uncharacterized protein n=1 Tax=Globodera rostochiensis TaxID=31243 RepID=A0A914HIH9_GLORO
MNYGNIFCHFAIIFICTSSSVTVKIALTDEETDNFYTKFLNLSNEQQNFDENIDKNQLQLRLTASNFYKDLLQLIRPILMQKNDKMRSKFDKFSKFVAGINKISHLNNCKIWLLRWEIINFSVENNLMPLPWDEATHMAKMLMIRQANCAEIGKFLEQNDGNQIESPPPAGVVDFLTEVTATHFKVFVTDLLPDFNCDFLQFFDAQKMDKETNFAHRMRMLRLENPPNNGKIAQIKKEIEQQFVGSNLMRQIEIKFPIYMAMDIIDDTKLGSHYAKLLSRDEKKRNNAELLLSNRIFSARIWTIYFNTHLLTKRRHQHNAKKMDAKTKQILAQIQTIWRRGLKERRAMQNILPNNNNNLNASLAPLHDQWLQLAKLYNQMPLLARDERVQIAQPRHQHVRHQLSDEHAKNMIRLASTKNGFSDCLQNSLFEGKGTKIRVRWFFTLNSEENAPFYDALVSKYSQIETLTRTELTVDEITQLQIKNYIKFFDRNNNEQIWRRAQFLLNVLAFYQWLKIQMNSLPDDKKNKMNRHMELLELFMDSASEVSIDNLKNDDYEINFTKHFNEIRAELLPKLIPKFDGPSIEAVLAQRNLHDEILTKLLLNNEFVKQLKTICVDVNRLRQICNDQTRIAAQISTQNCRDESKIRPQNVQENENAVNASSSGKFKKQF